MARIVLRWPLRHGRAYSTGGTNWRGGGKVQFRRRPGGASFHRYRALLAANQHLAPAADTAIHLLLGR